MTEAEWLASGDSPEIPGEPPAALLAGMPLCSAMIGAVPDASDRKVWLFRVACCRRAWHLMADDRSRAAVEVAERLADDEAMEEERDEAIVQATEAWDRADPNTLEGPDHYRTAIECAAEAAYRTICPDEEWEPAIDAALAATHASEPDCESAAWRAGWLSEQTFQCRLLRELLGNPFRPVAFDPTWRTQAVLSLARVAYDERELPSGHLDPARLAVLSDALEDAGCTDAAILDHLRSAGPHVRGCWALDHLLKKE
jgi:hypothetical protein